MNLQIRPPDFDENVIDLTFFPNEGFISIFCHCCTNSHEIGCFGGDSGLQLCKLHPDCKLPRDKEGFLKITYLGK